MKITLNGEAHDIADALTLEQLLEANDFAGKRVAVEINRAVISRSLHERHVIKEGDRIEIIHAIGGG